MMTKNNIKVFIFAALWIFVGFVGSLDLSLTVKYHEDLIHHEENQIARLILADDGWEPSRFVGLKMFFNIIVLGTLICIFKKNHKYGLTVASGIAIFQGWLLYYLLG